MGYLTLSFGLKIAQTSLGQEDGVLGKRVGYDAAWPSVRASLPHLLLGMLLGWLVLQAVTGQHEIT